MSNILSKGIAQAFKQWQDQIQKKLEIRRNQEDLRKHLAEALRQLSSIVSRLDELSGTIFSSRKNEKINEGSGIALGGKEKTTKYESEWLLNNKINT